VRKRFLVVVVVASVGALVLDSVASGAVPHRPVSLEDACTLVSIKRVTRAFGSPAQPMPAGPPPTEVCYVIVGSTPAEGGTLTATIEYRKGDDTAPDGIEAAQRVADPDIAGGVNVEPLQGVGKLAYLYPDEGVLLVAANKRLAFRLIWAPGGVSAPLTSQARAGLIRVAKDTVRRARRAH
jgi:hypothetical protein